MRKITVFVLLISTLSSLKAEDAPPPPKQPTEEEYKLAETYFNFTMGISQIYSEALINDSLLHPPTTPADGVIMTSILGVVHHVAIVREQPLSKPTAIPLFDKFLQFVPKNIPEAYDLLRGTLDKEERDLVLTSQMYTNEDIKLSPALKKLHVDLIKADLKDAATIGKINTGLKEKLASPLQEPYIRSRLTLNSAAKALLIDSVHITASWPVGMKKLEKAKFASDPDMVEMMELKGSFGLIETVQSMEVTIPFQNGKRFISFILPNKIDPAWKIGSEPAKISNNTQLRLQFPIFSHIAHELEFGGSPNCDFKKEDTFMQLIDDLTFMSMDPSKFEAIAISGAQINDVSMFKEDAGKSGDKKPEEKPMPMREDMMPPPPMHDHADLAKMPKALPPVILTDTTEKLLVFNRPFTFSVVDVNIGVLFSGSIESLQKPAKTEFKPKSTVLGMEKELAYFKCL